MIRVRVYCHLQKLTSVRVWVVTGPEVKLAVLLDCMEALVQSHRALQCGANTGVGFCMFSIPAGWSGDL